jgi:starvation-inducible outer membrane lipoprotein
MMSKRILGFALLIGFVLAGCQSAPSAPPKDEKGAIVSVEDYMKGSARPGAPSAPKSTP